MCSMRPTAATMPENMKGLNRKGKGGIVGEKAGLGRGQAAGRSGLTASRGRRAACPIHRGTGMAPRHGRPPTAPPPTPPPPPPIFVVRGWINCGAEMVRAVVVVVHLWGWRRVYVVQ